MNSQLSFKDHVAAAIRKPGMQLPVFNPVALELQQLLNDDETPNATIEATIQRDPALVLQVLRMANSSMYAGLAETTTLRQALTRVGSKQVVRLALAAAQLSLYQSRNALCKRYMGGMWQAAYASASGAAWLAEKSGHSQLSEQAFLAGLLHDVGKLVILRAVEQLANESAIQGPLSDAVVEEMLESLHCEYGYELMQLWNLPEQYRVVGRDHHAAHCNVGNVLLVAVRLADQVCRKLGIGCAPDPDVMPAASEEANALRLGEIMLADLEVNLEESLELKAA